MGFIRCAVMLTDPGSGRSIKKRLLVDTGAFYSVVSTRDLKRIGVSPLREESFELADGREITREVGEVRFSLLGRSAISPVIFGQKADAALLGTLTLKILALEVSPRRKKIIPMRRLLLY